MSASPIDKPVTGTQSIDRAADLLLRIIDADSPVTLTELVTATGLAKGTTSRILSALERATRAHNIDKFVPHDIGYQQPDRVSATVDCRYSHNSPSTHDRFFA